MNTNGLTVALLGDSITEGVGVSAPDGLHPNDAGAARIAAQIAAFVQAM